MDGHGYQRKWPVIIAMQGEPYSGKTWIGSMVLGRLVKYPIITLDDILDGLSPTCPQNVEIVMSQAFDIITSMVKGYTSVGRSVIIDTPLSRRSHLDKLVSLLTSVNNEGTTPRLSLVIIECKPSDKYWRELLFRNADRSTSNKWYKPQDWPPYEEFTGRDYTDDDIHPMVSKLVLDPCITYGAFRVLEALNSLTIDLHGKVVDMLYYQPESDKSNNPHKIDLPPLSTAEKQGFCRNTGHSLKETKGTDINDAACWICEDQVIASSSAGGVYSCRNCSLVIHKSCAEAGVTEFTPQTFPTFYENIGANDVRYSFPELHACTFCREKELEFLSDCAACLFECNMKCGLLPIIVHHHRHSHYLRLSLRPSHKGWGGSCEACGSELGHVAYIYCGKPVRSYHPQCLFSPPFLRGHQHCGYTHDLELIVERDEEFDDYICHLCFELMRPCIWYYRCRECRLDIEIKCAFMEFK